MSTREHSVVAIASGEPEEFHLVEETLDPSSVLLTASGELDIATAPLLRERLTALIEDGARGLVLDLSPVTFMDSVALAALLHARARLGDDGRMAIVLDAGSYTRLIFEIAGLPGHLDLFERRDDAIFHVAG